MGAMRQAAEASRDRASPPARAHERIRGIDAARAVAIVGMVMVHIGPTGAEATGTLGAVYGLSHGRASILFVLLAGLGVSLLDGRRSVARRRSAWARLGFRAALLLPLGLALQLLDHGVLVIVQYYAVYFVVAAGAMTLRDSGLLAAAVLATAAGPVAYLGAWHWQPEWFSGAATALTDPPLVIARNLALSGSYPLVVWSAPLLFGMWLGRHDLRATSARWRMVAGGLAVAVAARSAAMGLGAWLGTPGTEPSWLQLAVDDAHSEMPLWLLGATGAATAALGVSLVVADRFPRGTWPLVATGQLALTIYVGHLLVLAGWPALLERDDVRAAALSVARFTIVVAGGAVAWRLRFTRGPLEAALRLPWAWRRDVR
jgi:uncharacterized membrane protein